jgi:sugar transferase (PEP-CTERM system associated)
MRSLMLSLAVVEFALAACAFAVSAWVLERFGVDIGSASDRPLLFWAPVFSTAVVFGITATGLYQTRQRLRIEGVLVRLVVALFGAAVALAVVDFVFPVGIEGVLWPVGFATALVLLSVARVLFWRIVEQDAFRRRVLVYGAGKRASRLLELRRRSDQRGFRIVAFMPAPGDTELIKDGRVVEPKFPLLDYVKQEQIDEIIVAMDDRRTGFPLRDLLDCRFQGVRVLDLLTFLERETGKVKVDLVTPSWLIFADGFAGDPRRQFVSRCVDIVVSGVLAVVALPIMALVAMAVAIEDGMPVLYRQRRVGLMGKEFTLYKFRSMYTNAESDGKARWASAQDSRVTRVGAVIRKLRLDELPQVFNVLRGEMSLVGPRPERPEFVARLAQVIPYYHERHCVKPGITGWAQLCYPYGSSDEDSMEKLQFDLYYVKHRSLTFDLMVLIQTAEVVLWGKGAR